MKDFVKNAITKKVLIVLIAIIMISIFIMPNCVHAADDDEKGGKLFTPITELLLGIADRVEATLEGIFIGELGAGDVLTAGDVKSDLPNQADHNKYLGLFEYGNVSTYHIRYSPAVIFSGRVPALDINFISPMSKDERTLSSDEYEYTRVGNRDFSWKEVQENYGAPNNLSIQKGSALEQAFIGNTDVYYSTWIYNGNQYYWVHNNAVTTSVNPIFDIGAEVAEIIQGKADNINEDITGTLYIYQKTGTIKTTTKNSTAGELQPTIKKYYLALRNFALVGLLSVLVYIGIRIILGSTSSQKQAKYKAMLKDWLVAICILFLMHYMMAFMLEITENVTKIFSTQSVVTQVEEGKPYDIGDDKLMTDVRNKISGEDSYWTYFGYVLMYIALIILTVTFTIEYLKRVIFIAFLTMSAPLVALTYPLDKIKDGRAQAFGTWIKEYIFNCLIQPVHLLLYTIFIDSVMSLMDVNPLYAIVALAFFRPAEKFVKKMFGFDQANSISTIGAAAGGAMVMNMLNKLQGKAPKEKNTSGSTGTASGQGGVRTPTATSTPGEADSGATPLVLASTGAGGTAGTNGGVGATGTTGGTGAAGAAGATGGIGATGGTSSTIRRTPTPSNKNGWKALGKKIAGPDAIKSTGSWVMKNSIKAGGAFAGATLGVAAGLADGDFELPIKNLAIGATLGAKGAENLTGNIINGTKNTAESIRDTFNEGKYGQEVYSNMKFDKEFFKSDAYKQITQDPSIDQINIKQKVQSYLDNGITDGPKIREALQSGISGSAYSAYNKSGIKNVSDMANLSSANVTPEIASAYRTMGIDKVSDMTKFGEANFTPDVLQGYFNNGIDNPKNIIRILDNDVLKNEKPDTLRAKSIIAQNAEKAGASQNYEKFKTYVMGINPSLTIDDAQLRSFFDNIKSYLLVL